MGYVLGRRQANLKIAARQALNSHGCVTGWTPETSKRECASVSGVSMLREHDIK